MPLTTTLADLALLASIRGHDSEAAEFQDALSVAAAARAAADSDLAALIAAPPSHASAATIDLFRSILDAGSRHLLEDALARLPDALQWLARSRLLTISQLALVHRIGVCTWADLRESLLDHRIRRHAQLGAAIEAGIAGALPGAPTPDSTALGRAFDLVSSLRPELAGADDVRWAEPAGAVRRGDDLVVDIELVVAADRPGAVVARAAAAGDCLARGAGHVCIRVERTPIHVRIASPDLAGGVLLARTGDARHFEALQSRAAAQGGRLDASGLTLPGGRRVGDSEAGIYRALGLPLIPPELRTGDEAILAAAADSLPELLAVGDIRGDLHMHTHWSDGRDSVHAMVRACVDLGYEYLAITDHSPHSAASRNLSYDSVRRQADEIAALRDQHPQIAILHGCEVDILGDGSLDFSDAVLERFDIVLASLHDAAGHEAGRLLARYEAAMRHPLVSIVTHPANRMVPLRRGYALDFDRLFELAAETRTALEIDGAPSHLDLESSLARRAAAAGALIAVDSDSHRAAALGRQMALGVVLARRAWLEPGHVLNTRPLADVRAAVNAKRAG